MLYSDCRSGDTLTHTVELSRTVEEKQVSVCHHGDHIWDCANCVINVPFPLGPPPPPPKYRFCGFEASVWIAHKYSRLAGRGGFNIITSFKLSNLKMTCLLLQFSGDSFVDVTPVRGGVKVRINSRRSTDFERFWLVSLLRVTVAYNVTVLSYTASLIYCVLRMSVGPPAAELQCEVCCISLNQRRPMYSTECQGTTVWSCSSSGPTMMTIKTLLKQMNGFSQQKR